MTNYVCTELAPPQNGYIACKSWVVQQSPTQNFAITGGQAIEISSIIAIVFLSIKAYRVVDKMLNNL